MLQAISGAQVLSLPKTIEWFAKYFGISHKVFLSIADGTPHREGFGVPVVTSAGIAARKKDP